MLWPDGRSYVGTVAFVAYMSWSFALYAFDYKWAMHGWNAAARFDHVESRWAFFLGFGLVLSQFLGLDLELELELGLDLE